MSPGRLGPSEAGVSLLETLLVLALIGLLGALHAAPTRPGHAGLDTAQAELRACVEQAFLLARARGGPVALALEAHTPGCRVRHGPGCAELPPLILPRGVRWGLPAAGAPLPAGVEATPLTRSAGRAHPCVTLTPRRTAEAGAWYLTDGRDAVYLGLSDHGRITMLRWRQGQRRWRRA